MLPADAACEYIAQINRYEERVCIRCGEYGDKALFAVARPLFKRRR